MALSKASLFIGLILAPKPCYLLSGDERRRACCVCTHVHAQTRATCAGQVAAGVGRAAEIARGACSVEDSVSAEQGAFALSKPHAMLLKISVSPDSRFNLVKGSFQVSVKKKNQYSPIAFDISMNGFPKKLVYKRVGRYFV